MENLLYSHAPGQFTLKDWQGNVCGISGSQTSGLQELFELSVANGFPARAVGSSRLGASPFVLQSTIHVPTIFSGRLSIQGDIRAHGFDKPALWFDSFDRSQFRHEGILEFQGTASHVVRMLPGSPAQGYGAKAINYSKITLGCIIIAGESSVVNVIDIDSTYGSINNNEFVFPEIECAGKADYGVYVHTPRTDQGNPLACFAQTKIRSLVISAARVARIRVGDGWNINHAVSPLGTNLYELLGLTTSTPGESHGAIFLDTESIMLIPSISINAGNLNVGLAMETGSSKNIVAVPQRQANVPLVNNGTGNVIPV